MKIKTKALSYDELITLPAPARKKPQKPNLFFRTLVRLAAIPDLRDAQFSFTRERMEGFEDEPCLIVMNHSSFIDLEIVSYVGYYRDAAIFALSNGLFARVDLRPELRQVDVIPYFEACYREGNNPLQTPLPEAEIARLRRIYEETDW